ncbi:MAG: hypothetical protein Q9181_003814 [Wetmoreana brouardii]
MTTNIAFADLCGDDLPEPLPHVWTRLTEHAQKIANRPAVKSFNQSSKPTGKQRPAAEKVLVWTYADLYNKVNALAASLYLAGVRKGAAIVAFLDNRVEWALLFWVSVRLDAVFVPLNPRTIRSADELNHVLHVTKPAVLVVAQQSDAEELEQIAGDQTARISTRIILSPFQKGLKSSWTLMNSLLSRAVFPNDELSMASAAQVGRHTVPFPSNHLEQQMMVIFTSGTTSLPKASLSTYMNLTAAAIAYKSIRHLEPKTILLQHLPVFHAWSVSSSLAFWLTGATVVYPSRTFDARATLSAIEREACTHMPAVPSMIKALINHSSLGTKDLQSIQSIDLAGTIISPEIVEACIDRLAAPHTSAVYGMTEGNAVSGSDTYRIPYTRDRIPSILPCGTVMPGARLRVCKPGTRMVLKRGEIGELHIGGLQVTRGYLDRTSDDFYVENDVNWLVTGDRAQIDSNGLLYILGRYKDLIIRGGENLSPATIEQCLDSIAGIQDAQVVGIAEEIAGEVPVAVVRKTPDLVLSNFDIQQRLSSKLGKVYSPQHIFSLQDDLGMADYPRTTSGKVRKQDLRLKVESYMSRNSHKHEDGGGCTPTVERLVSFWACVSGRDAKDISPLECADTFADSITMMQFCNLVRKEVGKTIAVEDLVGDVDIQRQAAILAVRPSKRVSHTGPSRRGPPATEDMVHVHNDDGRAGMTRDKVEDLIRPYGLNWADVEDIFPTGETVALMTRRFRLRAWNRRHAYYVPDSTVSDLRRAVTSCLRLHPVFRSMIVDHGKDLPLYVVLRPNHRWFELAISDDYEVDSPEDLSTFRLNDDEKDYAITPGPLFRIMIVYVRNTNSAGLIYSCHHSTFDALSFSIWHEDVDIALRTGETPNSHVDFKSFAKRKYEYLDTPDANAACDFHVTRLKGWSHHRGAFWPPQRAPQFFRGSDSQWTHVDGTPGKSHERQALDTHPLGVVGMNGTVTLPSLSSIKLVRGITAQVLMKASLAIVNVHHTGADQAFFGQAEAARVWPTATGEPGPNLPNTMDIAGPTWEIIINRIHVRRGQSVLGFLDELQKEQKLLSRYAQAPFKKLESLLQKQGDGPEGHELHDSVFRRQCFNWLPNARPHYTHLQEVQSMSRADIGLQWNFMHIDEKTVNVNVQYDDCQVRGEEVKLAVEEVLTCARWIGEEVSKNGGEKKIGECPLLNKSCSHQKGDRRGWAID